MAVPLDEPTILREQRFLAARIYRERQVIGLEERVGVDVDLILTLRTFLFAHVVAIKLSSSWSASPLISTNSSTISCRRSGWSSLSSTNSASSGSEKGYSEE